MILDDTNRVNYCSPSLERITGYRRRKCAGLVIGERSAARSLARVAALRSLRDAQSRVGPDEGRLRIRTGNGSLRWFEWSASQRLDDEAVRGTVINARDVTERVVAEAHCARAKGAIAC